MTPFRKSVHQAVVDASAAGQSYEDVLCDLATVLACVLAAGSKDQQVRMARVKATMTMIATVMENPVMHRLN